MKGFIPVSSDISVGHVLFCTLYFPQPPPPHLLGCRVTILSKFYWITKTNDISLRSKITISKISTFIQIEVETSLRRVYICNTSVAHQ